MTRAVHRAAGTARSPLDGQQEQPGQDSPLAHFTEISYTLTKYHDRGVHDGSDAKLRSPTRAAACAVTRPESIGVAQGPFLASGDQWRLAMTSTLVPEFATRPRVWLVGLGDAAEPANATTVRDDLARRWRLDADGLWRTIDGRHHATWEQLHATSDLVEIR